MSNVVKDFRELLASGNMKEQDCQDFLERNTELVYTPFLLNHWIHFGSIISKFPLDTSLVTDFAYLTKSSDFWHLVLVELEHPHKKLFRIKSGQIIPTAELTAAISQVHSWQDFVRRNGNEVKRRLTSLLKPLESNPIYFKYLLVIGRGDQKSKSQSMRDRLASLGNCDFLICTYDSLISNYSNGPLARKNIIRLTKNRFEIKHLHCDLYGMLAHLTPEELIITPKQKEVLIADGYEIGKWEQGIPLKINGKKVKWWGSDKAEPV
ncbi:MAG: Shedu immune nuclease family protein [bacterium]